MPDEHDRELKPLPDAEAAYTRWIAHLDAEFTHHRKPELRSEIVRDQLHQLYLGRPHGGKLNFTMTTELPSNVLQLTFDPRNATLPPEYIADVDQEKYAVVKPLLWFWRMFDGSPAGPNVWLGFRFRRMLGRHIFQHIGKNVRIFHGVGFTFGYNLTIEDNCTVHNYALLDDRSELRIPAGTTISAYARVDSSGQMNDQFDETKNRDHEDRT